MAFGVLKNHMHQPITYMYNIVSGGKMFSYSNISILNNKTKPFGYFLCFFFCLFCFKDGQSKALKYHINIQWFNKVQTLRSEWNLSRKRFRGESYCCYKSKSYGISLGSDFFKKMFPKRQSTDEKTADSSRGFYRNWMYQENKTVVVVKLFTVSDSHLEPIVYSIGTSPESMQKKLQPEVFSWEVILSLDRSQRSVWQRN